jgi:hypothetical protein
MHEDINSAFEDARASIRILTGVKLRQCYQLISSIMYEEGGDFIKLWEIDVLRGISNIIDGLTSCNGPFHVDVDEWPKISK